MTREVAPKLSDSPARRDRLTAGGKAEAGSSGLEAQALQRMALRRYEEDGLDS